MNKEDFSQFIITEFQKANKEAMLKIGMSEEEAEEKNLEFYPSISFLLAQVTERVFEENISIGA
jgi:hypothetical protein